ncbi:AAA family ATPase, partial [Fervidobacterium thailandense]
MKELPLGLNDFKDLIKGNFVYVDKTMYIHELVKRQKGLYLLSRPRRFGKSLLLSTLYYLFKGERELFEGTWIYDKWSWEEYPVIRINLADVNSETIEILNKELINILKEQAKELGIELEELDEASIAFRELILRCKEKYGKKVVVLVDEYEKPVLDNVTEKEKVEEIRRKLRNFYGVLKAQEEKISFLLITGLTKFTKMGVFSALNNLTDISFKPEYAQMLGYTHEEVIEYFDEYIARYLQLTGLSKDEFLEMFREYYDGYSFDGIWYDEEGKDRRVYNPYAVLLFFDNMRFAPYWSETGAPSFVYEYLKKHKVSRKDLFAQKIAQSDFSQWEIEDNPPHLFLAQAGYLSTKLVTSRTAPQPIYELYVPNTDARIGVEKLLFAVEHKLDLAMVTSKVNELVWAVETRDVERMVGVIDSVYARVSWRVRRRIERSGGKDRLTHLESFYQGVMVSLMESAGLSVVVEEESAGGSADVVVRMNGVVYVIELK